MVHFAKDVMRMGPAPTLAREIPVAIFNLLFIGVVVALLVAAQDALTLAVVLGVAGVVYVAVRLVVAARRPARTGERR